MRRPVYRWRVTPPASLEAAPVEVVGATRYEAVTAAARIWRVPWSSIARECGFERLEEVEA